MLPCRDQPGSFSKADSTQLGSWESTLKWELTLTQKPALHSGAGLGPPSLLGNRLWEVPRGLSLVSTAVKGRPTDRQRELSVLLGKLSSSQGWTGSSEVIETQANSNQCILTYVNHIQ